MTTILVTGGAGFIGRPSVRALAAAGARVRVLDLRADAVGADERRALGTAVEWLAGDIRDADAVRAALTGVDRVLHLAARVSVAESVEAPLTTASHNVMGFLTVLEASRRAAVERFVYASSAAVYGDASGPDVAEDIRGQPLSPYALEKAGNESYAALYGRAFGLSCLGLRYFNAYGPNGGESSYVGVLAAFRRALAEGRALQIHGDGSQSRDFVHVDDVARANLAALSATATGVVNVASGQSRSLLEVVALLRELHGNAIAVEHLPPRSQDVRHSGASIARLAEWLGCAPQVSAEVGLRAFFAGR